jgi:hypothetical protein
MKPSKDQLSRVRVLSAVYFSDPEAIFEDIGGQAS